MKEKFSWRDYDRYNEWLHNVLATQQEEIERLKEQLNDEIQEELKQSEIMVKKQQEIERLNNIIKEAINFLENIGYDEELGRIWNDMNDDECTELLIILEGGKK